MIALKPMSNNFNIWVILGFASFDCLFPLQMLTFLWPWSFFTVSRTFWNVIWSCSSCVPSRGHSDVLKVFGVLLRVRFLRNQFGLDPVVPRSLTFGVHFLMFSLFVIFSTLFWLPKFPFSLSVKLGF